MKRILLGTIFAALLPLWVRAQHNPCVGSDQSTCASPPSISLAPVSPLTVSVCQTVVASTVNLTNVGLAVLTSYDEFCSEIDTPTEVDSTVLANWTVVYWNNQSTTNAGLFTSFAPGNVGTGTITFYVTYANPSPCGGIFTTNTSLTFTVTNGAPIIAGQPETQAAKVGGTASFCVTACGVAPLSYQWRLNGSNILNATDACYTLASVQPTDAGSYSVVITNSVGSVTSIDAVLTMNCVTVPSGLVACWRMEGNALDALGTHPGTLVGGASFFPGLVGQALALPGKPAGISVPDAAALNFGPGADFSIEAWIQPQLADTAYGLENIVDKTSATIPTFVGLGGYELATVYGQLSFMMVSSQSSLQLGATGGADLRDGKWHHVAVSVQRAFPNGGQMYVDGAPVASFDPTPLLQYDLSTSVPLLIGLHPSYWLDCNFRGELDEISLYNRALSAADIQGIYGAGVGGKCLDSDHDGALDYMDAAPNDPSLGILSITIDSPTNGASRY